MVDYVTEYFRLTPSVKYMYEFNCFILYFFKDSQVTQQSDLNYIGEHLDIRLAVVDNLKHNGLKHKLSLVLTNTGNKTIKPGDWSIYFYSFLMIEPEHLPKAKEYILPHYNLKLMHIKGSLFSITPTNGFPNLRYNQSHYSEFFTQYWSVTKTDGMSNCYVAAPSFEAVNIASTAFGKKFIDNFTSVRQWKRTRADRYNPFTAQARYRRYTIQDFEKAIKLVIPTPKLVNRNSDGFLSVINLSVSYESLLKETASFLSGLSFFFLILNIKSNLELQALFNTCVSFYLVN